MPYDRNRHHRRSIRLRGYDYASAGMYFVTICVQDRACQLGHIVDGKVALSEFGEIVDRRWQAIPEHFPDVTLDAYIVMPNHIHGIVVIGRSEASEGPAADMTSTAGVGAQHAAPLPRIAENWAGRRVTPGSLGAIVRSFKAAVTREVNAACETPGTLFWQRNYWEHIVRTAEEYERICTYIISNPALWADDRLYQPDEQESLS